MKDIRNFSNYEQFFHCFKHFKKGRMRNVILYEKKIFAGQDAKRGAKKTRTRGTFKLIYRKKTDNEIAKSEKSRQIKVHKTHHTSLSPKQHKPHQKLG